MSGTNRFCLLLAAVFALAACHEYSPGTLSGSVSGLTAPGLVLMDGGRTLAIPSGSTSFTFGPVLSANTVYAVSVQTQPEAQTCTVANGSGTVSFKNVSVAVTCVALPPATYTLGGTINGLSGSGLVLSDGSTTVAVDADAASFTFGSILSASASYSVAVQAAPVGETCTVAGGSGTAQGAAVSNVVVTCSLVAASLGGTVSGLSAAGLVLSNGGSTVSVALNATSFKLPTPVAYGSSYAVLVAAQPAGVACAVSNGTGTMPASAVTNVAVRCSNQPFSVGGSIAGLTTAGLVLANGADTVSPAANASSFTLPTKVAYAGNYAVTVQTQPTGLTCTVSTGSAMMPAANVTNVTVVCAANSFHLGGSISGLTAGGLVLANGTDTLSLAANAPSFTMTAAVAYASPYTLTVSTQPAGLTCSVSNGSGTMPANDVTTITVTCANGAYTLGGTITGLGAGGLILANGSDRLSVSANAAQFTMPTSVVSTSSFAVTVARQPSGLTCAVAGGTGTMPPGNTASVAVSCAARQWTWVSGSNGNNVSGTYGTQGTPAPGNTPGARHAAASWVDTAGKLWLYGGYTYVYANNAQVQDDLWEFDRTSSQWTWVGGAENPFGTAAPVYGTQGTPDPSNEPGARENANTWTDTAGNFWLFGGDGNSFTYNDLWKYDPNSHQWTWMGGSTTGGAAGVYGTRGTADPANFPGARLQGASWTDAAGNFWLFGGIDGSAGGTGNLNDLWRYSPASGQWTWMSGSTVSAASGVYGTLGTAAPGNTPGARSNTVTWADAAGNLWLFGGLGKDSTGTDGELNDLWRYDTVSGQWAWISGSNTVNAPGVYGTQGTAAVGNVPTARDSAITWTDGSGTLWLFGGQSAGGGNTELNDLWQYSPNSNLWTWVRGANTTEAPSVYGTQGTPDPGNMPGASTYMSGWVDPMGTFWLFGGNSQNSLLNTLWSY
jgi:N-acetylneuraminic acid mutarotase